MIGCACAVCRSPDPLNHRLRSSILVEHDGLRMVVDTTPDFRSQCLRANVQKVDAIVYTHEHSDHLLGLDEIRRFCAMDQKRLPAYGSARVIEYIQRIFPYAVENPPRYKGLPEVDLHEIQGAFQVGTLRLTPYRMPHGSTETLGFCFADAEGTHFAYLTDCKEVPAAIRTSIKGVPLLILDALRKVPHPAHLSVGEALEVVRDVQPGRTLFTHICHELEHHHTNAELPAGVSLAYDGQVIEI